MTLHHQHHFQICQFAHSHAAVCSCGWCGPKVDEAAVAQYSGAAHQRLQTAVDPTD
jgi:hypothetical protein